LEENSIAHGNKQSLHGIVCTTLNVLACCSFPVNTAYSTHTFALAFSMLCLPLLNMFSSNKTDHEFSDHSCNMCRRATDLSPSRNPNTCTSRPAMSHRGPVAHLPHTIINSNLGCRNHTFRLQFNRFLVEDPTVAVFSVEQEAPISSVWRDEDRRSCYGWARIFSASRSRCNVTMSVGQHWTLGVSNKSIRYWNMEEGVILVDWGQLYDSYFKQLKTKNQERSIAFAEQDYGQDEDLPPNRTMQRVSRTHHSPATANSTAHEIGTRFSNGLRVVRDAIRSRVGDGRPRGTGRERIALSRVPLMWTNPSYQRLR